MCSVGASDFRRSRARAKARVAACVTGSRQSPDCRRPLPPRRPRVFARPFRFFPEIVRASRRALGRRSGRLAPAPAEIAGRRGSRGGRLRRGCGAMLSSRTAPHPHPPRRAPPGGALRLASSRLPLLRPRTSAHRQGTRIVGDLDRSAENMLRTNSQPLDRSKCGSRSYCPTILRVLFSYSS